MRNEANGLADGDVGDAERKGEQLQAHGAGGDGAAEAAGEIGFEGAAEAVGVEKEDERYQGGEQKRGGGGDRFAVRHCLYGWAWRRERYLDYFRRRSSR